MTDIRKRAFVGLLGLGLLSIGCGSSSGTGTGGTSGGTGGSSATGTGGTHATGTGGTSAGTGGSGGASVGCPASDAPTSATIAGLSQADGGTAIVLSGGVMGGISTYGGTLPTYQLTSGGGLEIMQDEAEGTKPDYTGVVLYFNGNTAGTDCVNASTYTGVQFDISGKISGGCTLQYSTNDSEHNTYDPSTMQTKGACAPADNCYAPQLSIASLSTTPTTIKVPFADSSLAAGNPTSPIDPTKLTGVQWQITVPAAADGGSACSADFTVSNVSFY